MTTTSTNRVIHIGTLKNIRQFGCCVGADAVVGEAQTIAGVKGEYLKAAFDAVKKEYGSMENYIRNQLGVSDEALHQLREKYLEKFA